LYQYHCNVKTPTNKSTHANGTNSTVLPGEWQEEFDIPNILDICNQLKMNVDVAN
jgi:hypothetical protein